MTELFQNAWMYWRSGGWLMLPLAAVCFFLMYYLIRCRVRLHRNINGLAGGEADGEAAIRRDFVIITALTASAPLLGLLGTVMGMIQTFDGVGSDVHGVGRRMADGISQALITTQVGLVIAIPGLFGLSRLRRLLVQWMIERELERKTGAA
ncbi:MAG: MotA/TolQ/ExbB proton channel family protein [Kiritimatiellae bacterium]|nr:MotA/TolQ/ExbB proton channel family protein [Kiritimatiellia bacterium]